ncbi:hypothetical protein MOE74_20730 [Bacillus spizizenii]|nr:hypothetical protein [Bacillus spizizenii]
MTEEEFIKKKEQLLNM